MNLFAYGLLMHPELLAQLTGKHHTLLPASVKNYDRYFLNKPGWTQVSVAAPCPKASVPGVIIPNVTIDTLKILDAFECLEEGVYQRVKTTAHLENGQTMSVDIYQIGKAKDQSLGHKWDPDVFDANFLKYRNQVIPEFLADYRAKLKLSKAK